MLSKPSIAVNKWVVMLVGALLAMMAILVLSNPAQNGVFAHPHDPRRQTHEGVADDDTDAHTHPLRRERHGCGAGLRFGRTPRAPGLSGT